MDPTRTRKANVDNYQGRRPASDGRGRLPYGYRLIETVTDEPGPLLQPDAVTAPVVRRIFSDYAEGKGLQAIAESLTSDGILCPSAYDRVRNPHFSGVAWSKGTVRAILVNTRYAEWGGIRSKPPGFEPIIDGELSSRVQEAFAVKRAPRGAPSSTERVYRFRGLLRCGHCNRAMQGSWNNGEAYYRCRFPEQYADANGISHPRNVYLRERRLVEPLYRWLATVCPQQPDPRRDERAGAGPAPGTVATRQPQVAGDDPAEHVQLYQRLGLKLTYQSAESAIRTKIVVERNIAVRGVLLL